MYIKKNIQYQKTELHIVCHFTRETVLYKGNNKITELRTILQRESQNS